MNFQFIREYIYQLFLLSPYLFTSVVLVQCVYFSCRNNESHELDLSKSLWGILIITLLTLMEFFIPGIIDEIKESIHKETIIVSIAAGPTLQMIEDYFQKSIKVVRTMPNTPAQVGEAMSAIIPNRNVTENELNQVIAIFNSFGKCEVVSEVLIDSVIAVSGSSPAYVYMMIEAMADAAVLQGMPRNLAYEFAAQAVLGAAKMVLETGMHPGGLKDQVCSPGGTTIEAVAKLEQEGFRASIMNAMEACAKKSKKMSK